MIKRIVTIVLLCLMIDVVNAYSSSFIRSSYTILTSRSKSFILNGWIQRGIEWEWEDDVGYKDDTTIISNNVAVAVAEEEEIISSTTSYATPQLPSGTYRPKQSLGQNYLKDPNTVLKIIRSFHNDATTQYIPSYSIIQNQQQTLDDFVSLSSSTQQQQQQEELQQELQQESSNKKKMEQYIKKDIDMKNKIIIELGPGIGALTDQLVEKYGVNNLHCIEIDDRAVQLLQEKHPALYIRHEDVLQTNYLQLTNELLKLRNNNNNPYYTYDYNNIYNEPPLVIIGNLPYYITSQILFALADANHYNLIHSATVTMQREVGLRMNAIPCTKDYGILSVVFQIYCYPKPIYHYKIPPTVFYPKPKVDSALIGLHFISSIHLQKYRLCGVLPIQLRTIIHASFQQRRKTIRNSLKQLVVELLLLLSNDNKNNESTVSDSSTAATLTYSDVFQSKPLSLPLPVQYAALHGDSFAQQQQLSNDWSSKRPEELTPGQFIELTRLIYHLCGSNSSSNNNNDHTDHGDNTMTTATTIVGGVTDPMKDYNIASVISTSDNALGNKVWRKLKHGDN